MENKNLALRVSGVIFSFVAIAHLLRLAQKAPIAVYGIEVPLYTSLIASLVAFGLAIWMFTAAAKK